MLCPDELRALLTAWSANRIARESGQVAWLRCLVDRVAALDDARRDTVGNAMAQLRPLVTRIVEGHPDASGRGVRDVTTLCRRLAVTLDRSNDLELASGELRVAYAAVDLVPALRRVFAAFESLATDRGIDYRCELPSTLPAEVDGDKLDIAVATLLFKALKSVRSEGRIRLAAIFDESGDENIVRVDFTGAAASDRQEVASQLGRVTLSMIEARDHVGLHGGTLDATPGAVDERSFELRLPRPAPFGVEVSREPVEAPDWLAHAAHRAESELRAEDELVGRALIDDGRPLVLVIEPDRAFHRAIVESLEPIYATASAFDGAGGLALLGSLRPDLVIADLDVSENTSMIGELRGAEEKRRPVLLLTPNRPARQAVRLLDAGADDIMSRPIALMELFARVRRLIASKRARDVLSETIGQRDTDLIALADEVSEAHRGLEAANEELARARQHAERMSRMKSNFLRIMSHELKTPVTAMKLQIRVLERDPETERTPALERALDRLDRSTGRLLHLVDTVLEWARLEDGRASPEIASFALPDLLEEVIAELDSQASIRDLELAVVAPTVPMPTVESDRRLLRIVLVNLLERAISVSVDGTVEISIHETHDGPSVAVRDTGPKLSERQRGEALDPVGQVSDIHRRSGTGSGLGVYVSNTIARAIGGAIGFEDDGRPGNMVVLQLPWRGHRGAADDRVDSSA